MISSRCPEKATAPWLKNNDRYILSLVFVLISLLVPASISWENEKWTARVAIIESVENSSDAFYGYFALAAVQMAIRNFPYDFPNVTVQTWLLPGSCSKFKVGVAAAEAYYKHKVNLFIGPGCSDALSSLLHMATSWKIPIMGTGFAPDYATNKTRFPTFVAVSKTASANLALAFVYLMEFFHWDRAALFYKQDDIDLYEHVNTLLKLARLEGKKLSTYKYTDSFDNHLFEKDSRIVILFAATNRTIADFLKSVYTRNLPLNEFMFLTNTPKMYTAKEMWQANDGYDEGRKQVYQRCLWVTEASVGFDEIGFAEQIREEARERSNYHGNDQVNPLIVNYFDAMRIYGRIVQEALWSGEEPEDSVTLMKRMWNRKFEGATSEIILGDTGDRLIELCLFRPSPDSKSFLKVMCSSFKDGELQVEVEEKNLDFEIPPDSPKCGFLGDGCLRSTADGTKKVLLMVLFPMFFLLSVGTGAMVLMWKGHVDMDELWWEVELRDVRIRESLPDESKTEVKYRSSKASIVSEKHYENGFYRYKTALYRNTLARIVYMPSSTVYITKKLLADWEDVRYVKHPNIATYLGGRMDPTCSFVLTQTAEKGNLEDMIHSGDPKMDYRFDVAFINDIIEGMTFLHFREIIHGRLTTKACLVDGRYTVIISDFGLHNLHAQLTFEPYHPEYMKYSFFRAPELLRQPALPATGEMDLYSFAMVVYDIIYRETPFSVELKQRTFDELMEMITAKKEEPLRPVVDLTKLSLEVFDFCKMMKDCWSEDPEDRPSFTDIQKQHMRDARKRLKGTLMEQLVQSMEQQANDLEHAVWERNKELQQEKKRTEQLLYEILPRSIADKLKKGQAVEPENFDSVTIYFSDVVEFARLSSISTPVEIVAFLNDLYSCFDRRLERFDVYKVETIGDAYMVASGLPTRNGERHAVEIARMSLALMGKMSEFTIRHLPDEPILLRIGLHSGSVCTAVVGLKMPRYCLFGDTVNTASRMESTGAALNIHMSPTTCNLLTKYHSFKIETRGKIYVKGKGEMTTFWLLGEETGENEGPNIFESEQSKYYRTHLTVGPKGGGPVIPNEPKAEADSPAPTTPTPAVPVPAEDVATEDETETETETSSEEETTSSD